MPDRKSKRKRQTRLAFTPVSSSPPAAGAHNSQTHDRPAAIGNDGTSAKRRKLQGADDDNAGYAQLGVANGDPPTPVATAERSAEIANGDDEAGEESEPVRSTQRRSSQLTHNDTRQQQLDFGRARSPSTFSPPTRLSSSARPEAAGPASMFSSPMNRTKRQAVLYLSSTDEDSDEDELPPVSTFSRKAKGEEPRKSTQRPVAIDSDEEKANVGNIVSHVADEGALVRNGNGDEHDEDMPTTPGRQLRRRRTQRMNSFASSSPPRMVDSDDDLEIIERSGDKRRRRKDSSDDDDEDTPVAPGRRLKRGRQLTQQEQDDLAEDMDFLGPGSDVEALTHTPQTTQSKQKAARLAALEKLRRKRSGQRRSLGPSEEVSDVEGASDDSAETSEDLTDGLTSSRRLFHEEDDDANFIDEDDEGQLGVLEDVPIEFTQYARRKGRDLFKYAVEWMVHKKINPAFPMTDEIYDLTFRKLDDEVRGLAGSKFTSSAWTPQFTVALKSRPHIAFEPIDRLADEHFMRDKCDACNRGGHPATFRVQFHGKPYHPETLEEVGSHDEEEDNGSGSDTSHTDDDDDDDTDADETAYNAAGQEIPPASMTFYLGRFCMANAQTSHALSHWKYHLYEYVVDFLNTSGHNTAEKIIKRDKKSTKKRAKEANRIVDRMERDGVVKQLWKDFRGNLNRARGSDGGWHSMDSP